MTIDNIQNLTEEFVKRLQIPEARYSFSVANSNDFVELIITVDDEVVTPPTILAFSYQLTS